MNKTNFIIPSAGSARRLRPLTESTPKSLLRIGRNPIIYEQLSNIPKESIKRLIIILGYKGEQIKQYINSLDLDYPVIFVYNEDFEKTNCAYSFMKARDFFPEGFILLNCDLLFNQNSIKKILSSKSKNVIGARNNSSYQTDLQKINVINNKIVEWSLELKNSNAEVMGPLKISSEDTNKIINYFDSLSLTQREKMHCFSLFSNLISQINYSPIYINDKDWLEIDTPEDYKNANRIWSKTH